MNDNCTYCVLRGNLSACQATSCSTHESWYAAELNSRVERLTRENESLKHDINKDWVCCACSEWVSGEVEPAGYECNLCPKCAED